MHSSLLTVLLFLITIKVSIGQITSDSITDKTWFKKLNQSFGVIATGQGEAANLANYGSFEPVNGQFKFNIFGPIGATDKQKTPFFSVSAGGKIAGDNSAVLFNNSKFNSGINLLGKFHIPLRSSINISQNEADSIIAAIDRLRNRKQLLQWQASQQFDSAYLYTLYVHDSVQLNNTRKLYNAIIAGISKAQSDLSLSKDSTGILRTSNLLLGLYQQKDSLYNDGTRLTSRMRSNKALLEDNVSRMNSINKVNFESENEFNKKRDSLEMTITIRGSSFLWLTLTGGAERDKYYSFSDTAVFSKQFSSNKYTTYSYGIELNFVGFSGKKDDPVAGKLPHIHIANFGVTRVKNNNTGDLNTTELTDSRKYGSADSTHSLATKYNVYTDPIIEYQAWKLYLNYYYTFGKKRNFSLHVFPDAEFRNTKENPANIGAGIILSIKNKKDATTFNIELYGKLTDVGKALKETESSFINRNIIGVNLGIPFNFPTSK